MNARIELPYDRGHRWHLVVGEAKAVISEHTALTLAGTFKIPIQGYPNLGEGFAGEEYQLSKKARTMLKLVGIKA